ncbi:hypothetical protein H7Y63_02990 [Polaromonas sp.]|nr:hypothetical protein [Candidatus Saccharibacteria bacterium]
MRNFTRPRHTKRFISGAIAALFVALQLPLALLASPAVFATHGNGGNSGSLACPAGSVLLAKFNFQGNSYVAESGPTNVSISPTSTAVSGSFTVTNSNAIVSSLIVKAGNSSKIFAFSPSVQQGTFDNSDHVFANNIEQAGISNVQFCGTITTPPVVPVVTTGSVNIVKDVYDDIDNQDFAFTGGAITAPTSASFSLDDDGDNTNALSNAKSFASLPAGQYTVSEGAVEDWEVTSIDCTNTEESVSEDGRTVTFTLAAGTNVTCTFVNEKDVVTPPVVLPGSVTIIKDVKNGTDPQDFTYVGGAVATPTSTTFTLDDDGTNTSGTSNTVTYSNLTPGQYTVTENAVTDWKVKDIVCTNTTRVISNSGRTVTFTLAAGTNVTCTFVNEKDKDVTLCHATRSSNNPYEEITVNAAGAYDGHYRIHTDDITPTFSYDGHTYQARGNQALLDTHCLTPVVMATTVMPATVTAEDKCGTANDTFTIPTTTGVTYKVNGVPATTGQYQGSGTVTITAVAQTGFKFAVGAVTTQTLTFTNTPCETVGRGGGPLTTASTVLNVFTPQKTVAAQNSNAGLGAGELVNTGSTMLLNLFAGLFIIGAAGALTATSRRQLS